MRRLQQFALGHLQSSIYAGQEFEFELDDTRHKVYGDQREPGINAMTWSTAFLSSWITRNEKAQQWLLSGELDSTLTADRNSDSVVADFSRLYRSLYLQQDIRDALLMASHSPTTLAGNHVWHDVVRDLYFPQLDVIATIAFEEGETRFNQAIHSALLQHHHHYTTYPDSAVPRTAISLPLMGLAALAYDRLGYHITVENRYIPAWLVKKQDWSQLTPLAEDSLRLNFPVRTRNPLEK
ncbi:hypothetical protein CHH28_07615 [Bacterioplanes sanyensis]|uniref:Uncharacterized protein n=1 Tax=Bacterioplanes sanyensis TaxID=1249553 RepID=A0A222FIF2_9GAMM|nr:Imm49 family immunity protein [Bacterioplanes sanyensis]ASP38550.1 hypothetical protein CHH28_07615 [Bacterioplanes sanyensis]